MRRSQNSTSGSGTCRTRPGNDRCQQASGPILGQQGAARLVRRHFSFTLQLSVQQNVQISKIHSANGSGWSRACLAALPPRAQDFRVFQQTFRSLAFSKPCLTPMICITGGISPRICPARKLGTPAAGRTAPDLCPPCPVQPLHPFRPLGIPQLQLPKNYSYPTKNPSHFKFSQAL